MVEPFRFNSTDMSFNLNRCRCSQQCGTYIWPNGHSQKGFGQQKEPNRAGRRAVSLYSDRCV